MLISLTPLRRFCLLDVCLSDATAPEIRYAVSIQEDVLYEISKSLIVSRIAGNSIVSPYNVTRTVDPRIARVIHAEVLILSEVSENTEFEDDSGRTEFI